MESWHWRERRVQIGALVSQAALSPVLSSKLLEGGNFTLTDFIDPSVSAVSDSCLQEVTHEVSEASWK